MPSPTSLTIPLTLHEALSGVLGSISISCWIFLLIPQLLENYRNSSATAISLPFLFIWFLGDICNLLGGAWAGLVPTVIAIAVYFCVADGVLIAQCLYYNWVNDDGGKDVDNAVGGVNAHLSRTGNGVEDEEDMLGEEEPLLARQRSGSITIPGSASGRRRSSRRSRSSSTRSASDRRRSSQRSHPNDTLLSGILEEDSSNTNSRGKIWLKNLISILSIIAVGTAGWAIAYGSGAWTPTPTTPGDTGETDTGPIGAQVLGYASAIAYLGARIPQIVKNAREKSCEGLSLLFFILSLLGNLTYGAGILCHSLDRDYIITNVPWLIGSLGTMAEDAIIFIQFHVYARTLDDENEEAVV